LNLNQNTVSTIATPYSLDQWSFSAVVGQQVRFHLINASTSGLVFALTGPNGYSGFTDLAADSQLLTLPTSGSYTLSVHGVNDSTGSYAFSLNQTSVTDLSLGGTF